MTDHYAHIAGAVVGFLAGIVFLRLQTLKSCRIGAKASWWYSLLLLVGLFFAGVLKQLIPEDFISRNLGKDSTTISLACNMLRGGVLWSQGGEPAPLEKSRTTL